MAHTPGPWSRNIPPATKYTTVWAGRNTHVAHVDTRGLTPEEVEGNICLIAAAPDLLEACKALLGYSRNADGTLFTDRVNAAIAAIAKAEPDFFVQAPPCGTGRSSRCGPAPQPRPDQRRDAANQCRRTSPAPVEAIPPEAAAGRV